MFLAFAARAATRPRYGGTLRVELQAQISSLDPTTGPEDAVNTRALAKLHELLYDRLVRFDAEGKPQPALAVRWEHDAQSATWRFHLRPGVRWHDGSPLTPADVLPALENVVPGHPFRLSGDALEIDTGDPQLDLLLTLASSPTADIRRAESGAADTPPVGTGPFRIGDWQPGRRIVLAANDDYWGGRPYLDAIEIALGRPSRDQLIDLELDKADVVALGPAEARRAQQEGRRIWTSAPIELVCLWSAAVEDRRLREAIARSIDRVAIQKVLLQNFGEVAGGVFPAWLSGYGLLFSTAANLDRARQLRAQIGSPPALRLGYDANDPLTRQMAERVAVNARDTGITLQPSPLAEEQPGSASGTDLRIRRLRIEGPRFAAAVRQATRWRLLSPQVRDDPEVVYATEKQLIEDFTVVPLVHVPEIVGLGPRVKNWSARPWGEWRLDDVWVEAEKP
ncbi:MAG: ABC transporter substrate-binding protein [Acidobacteriia bacterium]|nr:ABC transporter substrate-binding protein [Terriglobia bacterium]